MHQPVLWQKFYPNKAPNGRTDYTPSNAGESYFNATDSAELIVAMKSLLPRLLVLGEARGWDKSTLALWRQMYHDLPDLPRGSIKRHGNRELSLEKSDLLAPVRHLSPANSYIVNRQNPELNSIWPGKLMPLNCH